MQQQIDYLTSLCGALQAETSLESKILLLYRDPAVSSFLQRHPWFKEKSWMKDLEELYLLLQLVAVEQFEQVLTPRSLDCGVFVAALLRQLKEVELFYSSLGGIVGYHLTFLRLLHPSNCHSPANYLSPHAVDISKGNDAYTQAMTHAGIAHLPHLAEVYPVGGCGDRLRLFDHATHRPLPVACLPFCGRSLLEGLVRDVQAREYLYFKLFGTQITMPIALMTSQEVTNHTTILHLCQQSNWFGRSSSSFKLFQQPLVPVVSEEGQWQTRNGGELYLKPGGHGALWQAAHDADVFAWLKQKGISKLLVRQINNPIAGIDYSLLAFTGIGFTEKKSFGFASCPRRVHASEGMNVVVEKKASTGMHYALSNVEYTEFLSKGIEDKARENNGLYSSFPANTNILFADIDAIERVLEKDPLPGKILNMKETIEHSSFTSVRVGRIESMMQNIAEQFHLSTHRSLSFQELKNLPTYLTQQHRHKTISVTKKNYKDIDHFLETPVAAFYDLMQNAYELLHDHCGFSLPSRQEEEEYLKEGPSFLLFYHPALGPLYSIIAQKLRRGSIAQGSELRLELAEADIKELHLKGSLQIESHSALGHYRDNQLHYSDRAARCRLHNVSVCNEGIKPGQDLSNFWASNIQRRESCHILLHENAEFEAESIEIKGSHIFSVPANHRMVVYQRGEELWHELIPISAPSWSWHYRYDDEQGLLVSKKNR